MMVYYLCDTLVYNVTLQFMKLHYITLYGIILYVYIAGKSHGFDTRAQAVGLATSCSFACMRRLGLHVAVAENLN